MSEVSDLLSAIESGDPKAAEKLLPLVYDQLRKLAAQKMAQEEPGQTLIPTALVHEAYLRLVGGENPQKWDGKGHFYAAAAIAMERILVENARRRERIIHGGDHQKVDLDPNLLPVDLPNDEVLAVHEALDMLSEHDPQLAELVRLRYFGQLTYEETAEALGVSVRTVYRDWEYARAWLYRRLGPDESS